MKFKCYDTCSLLEQAGHLFQKTNDYRLLISSISFQELENIKTAYNKDSDIKFAARQVLNELEEHYGEFDIILYRDALEDIILRDSLEISNDTKIIACCRYFQMLHPSDEVIFVTNDLACRYMASIHLPVEKVEENASDYTGYLEVYLDEEEMNRFYSNPHFNTFNLYINQYLLIYDKRTNGCVDRLCWTGEEYRHLDFDSFVSTHFGKVKPIKGDNYQMLLFDCLTHNQLSIIRGKAGTGKSMISLAYLIQQLEKGRIDSLVIFCNTVATRDAAKLG